MARKSRHMAGDEGEHWIQRAWPGHPLQRESARGIDLILDSYHPTPVKTVQALVTNGSTTKTYFRSSDNVFLESGQSIKNVYIKPL